MSPPTTLTTVATAHWPARRQAEAGRRRPTGYLSLPRRVELTQAMSAAAGIVRIHAQTIRPAMPQRTAERRVVAPTPTMAPVIVWVVLTGMPGHRGADEHERPGGLRAEAADRAQPGDPHAHRLDDPPAAGQRPQPDRRVRRQDDPQGDGRTPVPRWPVAKRSPAMIPIVFWASLVPCPRL